MTNTACQQTTHPTTHAWAHQRTIEFQGHLMDSLTLSKAMDTIQNHNGDFQLDELTIGSAKRDVSYARVTVFAETGETLEAIMKALQPLLEKTPVGVGTLTETAAAPGQWSLPSAPVSAKGAVGQTHILMCPPTYFKVEYAINPWMQLGAEPVNRDMAQAQWDELKAAIETTGAMVHTIPAVDGLPDMVFAANSAFAYGNQAVIAEFKHVERRPEADAYANWYQAQGYDVTRLPAGVVFEGQGDALMWGGRVFSGYKARTDIASHNWLTAKSGLPVISMELIDPRFYHMDVCFAPLNNGDVLVYPKAFDSYGLQVLEANIPKAHWIEITDAEACAFACNAVPVHNTVITNTMPDNRLRDLLATKGQTLVEVDMSEFLKAGGSAKCLTIRLA